MECIPFNPILEYNPNQLAEVRKAFGYEDLNKLTQAIDQLQDWITKQNHFLVKNFDRSFLERYIMANKGSVERAKKRFDRLCTLRNLMPEFLMNFNLKHEFEGIYNCSYQGMLPKPTPDNYRVLYTVVHNSDAHEGLNLVVFYRCIIMFIEYNLHHDYNAGYEVIVDIRNYSFALMSKLNPITIHKALTLFMEAYGLRMKTIHVMIGNSKMFETILSIFKQGMSSKLSQRLKIHTSSESLSNCFPKRILPKDYGGDEKSIKEITDKMYAEVTSEGHAACMKMSEQAITDEACRCAASFNEDYSGMPGSFKTLCVD